MAYSQGQKLNMLTLLESEIRDKERWWLCRCDCGTEKWIRAYSIKRCRSCGCFNRERIKSGTQWTHGMRRSKEWSIWQHMRQRCANPGSDRYPWYGARGIAVCQRWDLFENFYSDMGPIPSSGHSLDRIDVNGNYEPGNCRWATKVEQARNKRTTLNVTIDGVTMPLIEACGGDLKRYKLAHQRMRNGVPAALAVGVTYLEKRGIYDAC